MHMHRRFNEVDDKKFNLMMESVYRLKNDPLNLDELKIKC